MTDGIDALKYDIRKLGGLKALTSLLVSKDPDVKMSTLTALNHLFDDSFNRCEFRKIQGIGHLVKLVNSEFTEIRDTALSCLYKLSLDRENRIELRNQHYMQFLLEQFAVQENPELHKTIVACITQALKDPETLDEFGSYSPLPFLLKLLNLDDVGLKRGIMELLTEASHQKQILQLIIESGIHVNILALLSSPEPFVSSAAAKTLASLSAHERVAAELCKIPVLEQVGRMIHAEDVQMKRQGIYFLTTLFSQSKLRSKVKLVPDAFPVLIKHVQAEDAVTSMNACDCLCILGEDVTLRSEINKLGIMTALAANLETKNHVTLGSTLLCLARYLQDEDGRQLLLRQSPVKALAKVVESISSIHDQVSRNSIYALTNACCNDALCALAAQQGGVDAIISVMEDPIKNVGHLAKDALKRILEQVPTMKYWLTNKLTEKNLITDGFFDNGYAGKHISTIRRAPKLEELLSKPIRPGREILLVDFKTDDALSTFLSAATNKIQTRTPKRQVQYLATLVARVMGGPQPSPDYSKDVCKPAIEDLKQQQQSNVIPLGLVQNGTYYHRALLFKVICDRIGLAPCTLERGESGAVWNTVDISRQTFNLPNSKDPLPSVVPATAAHSRPRTPSIKSSGTMSAIVSTVTQDGILPKEMMESTGPKLLEDEGPSIVDLMFHPGDLLIGDQAEAYKKKNFI